MIMKISHYIRILIEKITKKDCSRCKHNIEDISCDNYQRYMKCASSFYPKGFEPKEKTKGE